MNVKAQMLQELKKESSSGRECACHQIKLVSIINEEKWRAQEKDPETSNFSHNNTRGGFFVPSGLDFVSANRIVVADNIDLPGSPRIQLFDLKENGVFSVVDNTKLGGATGPNIGARVLLRVPANPIH